MLTRVCLEFLLFTIISFLPLTPVLNRSEPALNGRAHTPVEESEHGYMERGAKLRSSRLLNEKMKFSLSKVSTIWPLLATLVTLAVKVYRVLGGLRFLNLSL